DTEAAKQFYTNTLGFQVVAEAPGFVQFAGDEGATLALSGEQGDDPVELWWQVEDVDAEHDRLRAAGVEIVSPPQDQPFGRALTVKDHAGNALNFFKPPAA